MTTKTNYFQTETADVLAEWDNVISYTATFGEHDKRKLTEPLPCGNGFIPAGFKWNGASVGPLRFMFPKWKHPIATCRHDFRCERATTWKDRNIADKLFSRDVAVDGNRYERFIGYIGVRLQARLNLITGKYS